MEAVEDEEDGRRRELEKSKSSIHTSFKTKLIEIFKNLHSAEVTIYSEASKEFVKLLKGDSGGIVLQEYIQLSPKCSEILESWRLHQGKPGLANILSLFSVIFDHPAGKSWSSGIFRTINNLAYAIFKDKLEEIYVELNSQERRRQNAALFLLASIVKRGIGLASEVAKTFDFKLPVLSKLYGFQKEKGGKEAKRGSRRSYTRQAFIRFAMSFIEAGNPRLLRWILQQREIYSGVFRGLGGDDIESIAYVLSTLKDKVLIEDSLIPPGLRSVLFGSITLEQLSNISGNSMAGPAADLAHEVLVMVCTEPCNGLMPSINLKGNEKRLFELMKKLKATEVAYHKDLLLAIVKQRPSLCVAYMDEFPYNLKPRSSSSWFAAVTLAADMISSVNSNTMFVSVISHSCGESRMDKPELQNILKCIVPRPLTRSVISTGLQHADDPVKHGILRVVLESLKSLAGLMLSIDNIIESISGKQDDSSSERIAYLHGLSGVNSFIEVNKWLNVGGVGCSASDEPGTLKLISLKLLIQDEVRAMLPEPQVLLKLLSSSGHKQSKLLCVGIKRCANLPEVGSKKLKVNNTSDGIDIIIGGIITEQTNGDPEAEIIMQELDVKKDDRTVIAEIWGLSEQMMIGDEPNSSENFFQSKLLDAFKYYLRTVPLAIEGSFDFFKILPMDPSSLSTDQLQSLLSLLLEYVQDAPRGGVSDRVPKFMYKHLQRLLNILVHSHVKGIQEQAYILARAAMISTGAFDQNFSEIDAWLYSLTGYCINSYTAEGIGAEALFDPSTVVSSFLCDAVSTIGNNLYKYLDQMRENISRSGNLNDDSPGFSPLVICVLEKCLRLLESESRTYKVSDKSMISLYACNTISLILQTQVDVRTLSALIHLILTEKFNGNSREVMDSKSDLCEWRPVKNLLCLAKDVLNQDCGSLLPISESATKQYDGSFFSVVDNLKELLEWENGVSPVGVAIAFSSSIICATPDDLLKNFPLLLTVTKQHLRSYLPFLSWVLSPEPSFLASVTDSWLDMFSSGLKMIEGLINDHRGNNLHLPNSIEVLQSQKTTYHLDSTEPASSAAFGLFLYSAPFYALFSAIMRIGNVKSKTSKNLKILLSKTMLKLLQLKLSKGSLDDYISYLRNVLFWTNQTMSSFRTSASAILQELLQICVTLVQYIVGRIVVVISDTSSKTSRAASVTHYVQDVIDLIFQHPIVTFPLSQPLCFSSLENNMNNEQNIMSSSVKFHPVDCDILQLLRTVFDFVFAAEKLWNPSSGIHNSSSRLVLSAPKNLIDDMVEKFKYCISNRDAELLLRWFYTLDVLKQYASPFELLEVVHWMFEKLEDSISGSASSFVTVAVSIGMRILDGALGMLFNCLQQPTFDSEINWLLDMKARNFDVSILLNLYHKILEFGNCSDPHNADACLLKFVSAVYSRRLTKPHPALFPLCAQLSRMITNSPIKLLLYCFYPTSKIKGRILLQLIEESPMHMNFFGKIYLGILNNDFSNMILLNNGSAWLANEDIKHTFSNDDYMILLPAALSYLMSVLHKHGEQKLKPLGRIANFYLGMLLDSFSNWNNYVSQDIFQEEYAESVMTSPQDFHKFCSSTLLGKAVTMLRYSFILSKSQVKDEQLLRIFDTVYSDASLFDPHVTRINLGSCSYKESLKIVYIVAAKISFTRLLLFPPGSLAQCSVTGKESNILDYANRLMGILVNTLDHIVKKIPLKIDISDASCDINCYPVFRFLEHYILSNIVQLSMDIKSYFWESPSIPFLDQFFSSSLHHRFEDSLTLRAIRCILVALSEERCSWTEVLALFVRHPKFIPTISRCCGYSDSSSFVPSGTLLQPLPSILKSVDISCMDQTASEGRDTSDVYSELQFNHYSVEDIKMEAVKLLRILFHFKGCQEKFGAADVDGGYLKELLSLLLSGYGATMSEIDLEIFHLMYEIEMIEGSYYGSIADVDYLWGSSAMKLRNELAIDRLSSSNMEMDSEMMEERRKMLFRENIPVDSKLSMMTVLHFCEDRSSTTAPMSLKRLLEDKFVDISEKISSSNINIVQRYDPAFILRFSIHCLSMGYLEPIEFSRIGLLAITFASISSPDEELRNLGYGCLGKFKKILEKYQKRKDTLQLQLLLTYIQNGITEEWQRIPSVVAIFAAEASLILLDPSQTHFLTLSDFLMHSHKMNLKTIPLFPKLFKSGSIHFQTDRLWILRLLYAGLNSDIDAEIYKKQDVLKILLSFCASSLSDHESKILTLRIMKKCLKLPTTALHLIKKHGLLSWLSSILLCYGERIAGDHKEQSLEVLELVLKVINDAISVETISEWLQEDALEQLSDLSSHLHALVVSSMKLLKGNVTLVNSLLSVMASTLKISQNRKIYQPRLTLSLVGLFQLYQAVNVEPRNRQTSPTNAMGLNIILLSAPVPVATNMDRMRLSKLLIQAIPAALQPCSMERSMANDNDLVISFKEQQEEESLISKLLRWAVASVILGSIANKYSNLYTNCSINRSKIETLQSILEQIIKKECGSGENSSSSYEALAIILLYLQQLLGRNCNFLPSVILALCLLLLGNSSTTPGSTSFDEISDAIASHCTKIYCPPELNPDWTWSYDKPWQWRDKGSSSVRTVSEQMEEEQACRSILLLFSSALGVKPSSSSVLSYEDVKSFGLYEWERDTLIGKKHSRKRKETQI